MKNFFYLVKISGLALLMVATPAFASTLDDLYQQKKDLQDSIAANKQEINNIQDMISNLSTQTAATQKQIDLTNQIIDLTIEQINQTQAQIEQKQKELDKKKADLNESVVTYYETGTPSTMEILVSSNNLSDIIDKSQYVQALSDQINNQALQIAQVKADLENQKSSLEKQKGDLEAQRSSLADQQRNLNIQAQQKNNLLSQANNKQAQLKGDLDNVSAEIYAQRRAQGGYTGGGTGGYPYAGASDTECNYSHDPWGFCYRQCTSFAAWYWNDVLGKSWYAQLPSGQNHAKNWPILAQMQGYGVYSSPEVGDIVSWPAGGIFGSYGHVAIVIAVNGDGTFRVAQYNWSPLAYSEMNVSGSLASSARFIR